MKYLAYTKDGRFKGYNLLENSTAASVVESLKLSKEKNDVYVSIQDFNKDAEPVSCPLYADFDNGSSKEDAAILYQRLLAETKVEPLVYFSGNKGFHVVSQYVVTHPKCAQITKYIMERICNGLESLDHAVYTNKRLWRVVNTMNTKSGLYKIPLSYEELTLLDMDAIKQLARQPKELLPKAPIDYTHSRIINDLVSYAIEDVSKPLKERIVVDTYAHGSWKDNMLPCIEAMIDTCPDDGYTNTTIVALGKFFKFYGTTMEDCLDVLLSQDHYYKREQTNKDVVSVIRSIYANKESFKPHCEYGNDRIVMKKNCFILCQFSKDDVGGLCPV